MNKNFFKKKQDGIFYAMLEKAFRKTDSLVRKIDY